MPTNTEILNALGTGSNCLRTHKNLQPVKRPNGEYFFSTGNFSLVVKMHDPVEGKYYAVKCFTHIHPKLIESYSLIGKHLQINQSPYLVHYEFCDNEIWVNSELDGKKGYPVIIMEWIEGKTLGNYLAELVSNGDKKAIFQLACRFDALSLWLLEQPFAHGDLKTDNILIDSKGRLSLIDYDGMFTPEMQNQQARENGSPGFRHPNRNIEHFGPQIDDFSILLISLSLHTLAIDHLLCGLDNSYTDYILFTEDSINNSEHSTWQLLENLRDNSILAQRLVMLQMATGNPATIRLFGIKPILQSTAIGAPGITDNIDSIDENIEIYLRYNKDSKKLNYGLKQKSTREIICNPIYDYIYNFSEGLALVINNKKYGFIDELGKLIIPALYNNANFFSEGLALVVLNRKYGFIDKFGKVIIPLIYDFQNEEDDSYPLCVDPLNEFNSFNAFSNGLASVALNGRWGFIDKEGKVIIPFIYDDATFFSEGIACVQLNGKWGYIDKKGEIIVPFCYNKYVRYDKINDPYRIDVDQNDYWMNNENAFEFCFKEGLGVLKVDDKYGFIDKSGKVIIPYMYDEAENFSEGLACVKLNNMYGYIDKSGIIIISFEFYNAKSFSEGLAIVWSNAIPEIGIEEKYGFIDKLGKIIVPMTLDWAENFSEGLAMVIFKGSCGFINKTGKIIVPLIYHWAHSFSGGLNYSSIYNKTGFFPKGLAQVGWHKYGIIVKSGKEIVPLIYDEFIPCSNGMILVKFNDKYGFIDYNGNVILPIIYDKIDVFSDGLAKVHLNDKKGFINETGQVIIPIIYEDANYLSRGLARVYLNGKEGYIDITGIVDWVKSS